MAGTQPRLVEKAKKRFNSIDDSVVHEPASDYMDVGSQMSGMDGVSKGMEITVTPSMASFATEVVGKERPSKVLLKPQV